MNILRTSLFCIVLLAGPRLGAEPPAIVSATAADPAAEVLPILQAKYVGFKALNYRQGDHLGDLIARSNGGISLRAPEIAPTPLAILTATLPGGIIYWRLASFVPAKSWLDLGAQLEQERSCAPGIILDVRSNVAPDDYHGAAEAMKLFDPQDPALSKYDAGGDDHPSGSTPIQVPIVVLTNGETSGAAEALAACLKADGALVVGRPTGGQAAVFEEQALPSGQVLRFAVETLALPDGVPLLGHPVVPDIALTVNEHAEKASLTLIRDNHIFDVIQESAERHRMSEASLVQGQDPEWDDYLASLERRPFLLTLPVIHDVVLISAMDSLKAIRVSQRSLPGPARTDGVAPVPSSIQ